MTKKNKSLDQMLKDLTNLSKNIKKAKTLINNAKKKAKKKI